MTMGVSDDDAPITSWPREGHLTTGHPGASRPGSVIVLSPHHLHIICMEDFAESITSFRKTEGCSNRTTRRPRT